MQFLAFGELPSMTSLLGGSPGVLILVYILKHTHVIPWTPCDWRYLLYLRIDSNAAFLVLQRQRKLDL